MEWLTTSFTEMQVYAWDLTINDWFFALAILYLLFELGRLAVKKLLSWNIIGDTLTNYVTLTAFMSINFLLAGVYLAAFYLAYEYFSITQLPITIWSIALCVALADFIYYWEHRFMHRVGIGWATHTVHHSSPYFNISVAYRFGPMDGIVPVFFHLPLAMIGFNPIVILFAEIIVQLYQTALHTEVVKKLPRWYEAIMNTPSHHRVHHGSNPQYIDKNYAGIFIIWDKMFGTFEPEVEPVRYGITTPLNSVNPFIVFFHGITGIIKKMVTTTGFGNKLKVLIMPPGWEPKTNPHASE